MNNPLEGVADLTAKLNDIAAGFVARELRGTVKTAMQEAEHAARARIPQGTEPHKTFRGRLVSPGFALQSLHIETRIDKRAGGAQAMLGVSREAFYALQFVELGTSKQPAQPWLVPAFESQKDPMLSALAVELRRRVERIARRKGRR